MDSQKPSRKQMQARRGLGLMKRMLVGVRARLDEELRGDGVTTAQLRFLYELGQQPGSSGAHLARACYVTPQSLQTMLKRSVERGWVVRGTDPDNGRLVTARLTPRGEKLLAKADAVLMQLEREIWAGIGVERLEEMNAAIEAGLSRL